MNFPKPEPYKFDPAADSMSNTINREPIGPLNPEIETVLNAVKFTAEAEMTPLELYEFRLRLAAKSLFAAIVWEGRGTIDVDSLYKTMAKTVETIVAEDRERSALRIAKFAERIANGVTPHTYDTIAPVVCDLLNFAREIKTNTKE